MCSIILCTTSTSRLPDLMWKTDLSAKVLDFWCLQQCAWGNRADADGTFLLPRLTRNQLLIHANVVDFANVLRMQPVR